MPVQNMYRVRATLSGWNGGPGLSTFYYKTTDPTGEGNASDAFTCATRVHSALANLDSFWPAFMQITVQPVVDVIQDVTGALVASWVPGSQAVINGVAGQNALPQASMLAINYSTLDIINGHRVRGRTFLGPLRNQDDADGTPNSSQLTQGAEFLTDIRGSALPQVVWHRPKSQAGGQACLVTGGSVNDRFAVLRSRRG